MKSKIKGVLSLFFVFISLFSAHSQENTATTGGIATGSGGTISYSVGQIFFNTNSGNGGIEIQGVQQPFEIFITDVENTTKTNIVCLTFPNPTSNFLTLKVENGTKEQLIYQLFDINGRLLDNCLIKSNLTIIQMANYAPAVYFLKILIINEQDNTIVRSFKIVKN